jgi:hypothetical protein
LPVAAGPIVSSEEHTGRLRKLRWHVACSFRTGKDADDSRAGRAGRLPGFWDVEERLRELSARGAKGGRPHFDAAEVSDAGAAGTARAVADETVVFSWIEWPDNETRYAAMAKMADWTNDPEKADPRRDPELRCRSTASG